MKTTEMLRPLFGLAFGAGLSLLSIQSAYAESPAKDLSDANQLIHWPPGFEPAETDVFVHNEIRIKAPPKVIWANLINAVEWPSWYSNSSDVRITGPSNTTLRENSHFLWKTFGFAVDSKVHEFAPESRIGWFGDGVGIRAYHTWLIIENPDGCVVITEETQKGPSAVRFHAEKPAAMYEGHELWLQSLKARSEDTASAKEK
jgi:hypothetical protein